MIIQIDPVTYINEDMIIGAHAFQEQGRTGISLVVQLRTNERGFNRLPWLPDDGVVVIEPEYARKAMARWHWQSILPPEALTTT